MFLFWFSLSFSTLFFKSLHDWAKKDFEHFSRHFTLARDTTVFQIFQFLVFTYIFYEKSGNFHILFSFSNKKEKSGQKIAKKGYYWFSSLKKRGKGEFIITFLLLYFVVFFYFPFLMLVFSDAVGKFPSDSWKFNKFNQ